MCPGTIYVTVTGSWKLGGLEHSGKNKEIVNIFMQVTCLPEKMGDGDSEVACTAWTTKMPKAAQPNLNYTGPDKQKIFIFLISSSQPLRFSTKVLAALPVTCTALAWSSSPASTLVTASFRLSIALNTISRWPGR